MQLIIAGCSSAIIMHLTTCYKQIVKHWRQQLIMIKNKFGHLKCIALRKSKIPNLTNKGAECGQ